MKIFKSWFCLSLLIIVSACGGPKVLQSEKADDADLATYKTYDFYRMEATGDTISDQFSDRTTRLQDAIALQLQKYGLMMSKTNPDLLVNIGIVVDEKDQTRQTDFRTDAPRYIGQRRYSWKSSEVKTGTYKLGTISVDLVDRKQNQMVWSGTVQDVLPNNLSKIDAKIKEGVEVLFKKFPLPKKN